MIELEILAPKEDKPKDIVVTCSSLGDTTPKINLQGIQTKMRSPFIFEIQAISLQLYNFCY